MKLKIFKKSFIIYILFLAIVVFIYPCNLSFAQYSNLIENKNSYTAKFPSGTFLKGILQENLSTGTNHVGDTVTLIIPFDISLGNVLCIPKDSILIGKIVRLQRPQIGMNGLFQIVFHTLALSNDKNISILGHIWTKNNDGIIGGELTNRTSYKYVPHYIEGLQTILKKIPDGPRTMGKDTNITASTEWIIVLDKELVLLIEKE